MEPTDSPLKAKARALVQKAALVAGITQMAERLDRLEDTVNGTQSTQILLSMLYKERAENGKPLPTFDEVEFRVHSQNGEDGILLYLFSLLGTPTKKCVEVCAADGIECNTANLVRNHGWRGLMIDGSRPLVAKAQNFYRKDRSSRWQPPKVVEAWVTTDSVNSIFADNGFDGDTDLLSLDMDGVDYWIWKALTVTQPLVVVAEYNWGWGPDEAMTVPYEPAFAGVKRYYGASLAAFTKLGKEKGYRLVGNQRWGFNAFFIKNGFGEEYFPEIPPAQCFDNPVMKQRWSPESREDVRRRGKWIEV